MPMHGWPPFNDFVTRPPGLLHHEKVGTLKLSHELKTSIADHLRRANPPNIPTYELHANNPDDMERFHDAHTPHKFVFAAGARQTGARRNVHDGALVGTDRNGCQVWASLIACGPCRNSFACDAPHRAFILMQVVDDQRDMPGVNKVVVAGLKKWDDVTQWHAGIQGDNLVDRYCCLYDALVEEAGGG